MNHSVLGISPRKAKSTKTSLKCGGSPCLGFMLAALCICLGVPGAYAQSNDGGSTFTVLHNFSGVSDGNGPSSPLIRDAAGNFYGTTLYGGSTFCSGTGCGVVFKMDAAGNETVLYRFTASTGMYPIGSLARDPQGNLYGTTAGGGGDLRKHQGGHGVIFKVDATGKETVLYRFSGFEDGNSPEGGLVRDAAGNLYGTTWSGGDHDCLVIPLGHSGCGVVFKLDHTGKFSVLHAFHGADGANVDSPLLLDSAGNLYGTTFQGGDLNCPIPGGAGCGVVFKIDSAGNETVLYTFRDGTDGGFPQSGLILDADGTLYGTASAGGGFSCPIVTVGCGVVFRLSAGGTLTHLYSFQPAPDGNTPFSTLVRDSAGNLYGTSGDGGTSDACPVGSGCGTVFKLDPSGNETILHSFSSTDGSLPTVGMVSDQAGNLYGVARQGGTNNSGVVFKVTP